MADARSILIVDDDTEVRQTLIDLLGFEGLTAEAVANGQEALDWLHRNRPAHCLVLLDLMMPVMDGKTFLDIRAGDPELRQIPVIVLTAGGDCRDLLPRHHVARCLSKTVAPTTLIAAIVDCA